MTAQKSKGHSRTHQPAPTPLKSTAGLKPWHIDLIACVGIFLAVFIFFHQIPIEGKTFSQGDDTVAGAAIHNFVEQETAKHEFPMWNPYLFGGLPGLASGEYFHYEYVGAPFSLAYKWLSPRYWVQWLTENVLLLGFGNDGSRNGRTLVANMLFIGLLTYLLLRRLNFQSLIAAIGGIAMAWNPYLISLATAAHGGKLVTFIYMPLIILCTWNLLENRRWFDMALLALAFGWQVSVGAHAQILFYSGVTIGLLYLVWLIFELRQKASLNALRPAVLIAVALILGIGVGALSYYPLLKYVPYSIRGMGPAIAAAGSTQTGYSMADATMWSFSPAELITFAVPSWFGLQSPYYWGDMPFTSSSFYFGVIPLLFAVLAFFGKKNRLFWGLVAVSVFSILLSFGNHFGIFYSIFFNLLPFFNKFRTPSLILLLVVMAGMIFAGYGLKFVIDLENREKWRKIFLVGVMVCAVLLVLFLFAGNAFSGLFGSFSKAGEETRYNAQQLNQLRDIRFTMLRKDLLFSLLWLAVAFLACWLKITGKIKANAFLAIVLLITVIDLARFSSQFFDPQSPTEVNAPLNPNKIVETLQQDKSIFRVMPLGRLMQDNRWASWEIASLGGYHGAKMRSYQDLLDNVFFNSPDRRIPLNIPFLSAMNCKYFVAEGQLPESMNLEVVAQDAKARQVLYRNPRALPRAFFIDSVIVNTDRASTVRMLMDPAFLYDYTAIIDKPLPGPTMMHPDRTAEITLYTPHRVRIAAKNPAPALLILTDAYYAPGWTATVDGMSSTIYKVDGFVRGVYLHAGEHVVEFRYAGKYEMIGETTATISHFVVWGLVIGCFLYVRKRRKTEPL